ncbi:MAG: type II toxin-antitoxin system RelE/ParE family toxin [Methylococcaceae bacterium]|nr:type II toxin-antitoxin system RelE/ParE family toxin [Methylococcaceae bacterium]
MTYSIELKKSAKKSLSILPKHSALAIQILIDGLSENPYPHGYKKLVGSEHTYRIRSGNYRVIYSIFDKQLIVQIVKIGHRKEIYK